MNITTILDTGLNAFKKTYGCYPTKAVMGNKWMKELEAYYGDTIHVYAGARIIRSSNPDELKLCMMQDYDPATVSL